jgi:hypothetical protein
MRSTVICFAVFTFMVFTTISDLLFLLIISYNSDILGYHAACSSPALSQIDPSVPKTKLMPPVYCYLQLELPSVAATSWDPPFFCSHASFFSDRCIHLLMRNTRSWGLGFMVWDFHCSGCYIQLPSIAATSWDLPFFCSHSKFFSDCYVYLLTTSTRSWGLGSMVWDFHLSDCYVQLWV